MPTLKTILRKQLNRAKRIALLGVGSELRGDDIAGILVCQLLEKECRGLGAGGFFRAFNGATAPENLTGEIKKFKPTHLIIVDSAKINKAPGAVKIININKVAGLSFCTHNLPIKILTDYLINSIGCKVIVIGIQPKRIDFGSLPSRAVKESVNRIVRAVKGACAGLFS